MGQNNPLRALHWKWRHCLRFQATGWHCNGCIIPQAVTHSLVLLKMGRMTARNVLSWLELLINQLLLHLVGCIYYL